MTEDANLRWVAPPNDEEEIIIDHEIRILASARTDAAETPRFVRTTRPRFWESPNESILARLIRVALPNP